MTKDEALADLLEVVEASIKSGDWKVDGACDPDIAIQRAKNVLAQQQDKGLGACPISRTNDLEIKPNDRRTETSNHYLGKDDSRIIQTRRGAEIHTGGAELGAYSGNLEQYEGVNNLSGPSAPAQPKQELVATKWLAEMIMSDCGFSTEYKPLLDRIIGRIEAYDRANTPPQRKPLTDDEIEDIWADCPADWDDKINVLTLARAIEAKLKEKNK